jgi:hypothetical protein
MERAEQVTEVFSHPDAATASGQREAGALCSPAVRNAARARVTLAGYRDLPATTVLRGTGEKA